MYNVRQFKSALYLLLLLGVTGFAVASESPGLWLLTAGGILLNAWLVKSGRFTPMPRLLANAVTLFATAVVAMEIYQGDNAPLLTIGQFLALLHVVKLFEQRANRDYAQLLVLSLLLMVAGAISTASLLFGMIFTVYLFLSLYCCLLFHLKVEADHARAAYGITDRSADSETLVQDQRYLSGSMRRLTGLIATAAVISAVLVFLFFPRGGAIMFAGTPLRSNQAMTGFSDIVSFQRVAQITENNSVMARVEISVGGTPLTHPIEPFYFRGSSLDTYSGREYRHVGQWTWTRGPPIAADGDDTRIPVTAEDVTSLNSGIGVGSFRQKITLEPTGTRALFALAGLVDISSPSSLSVRYARHDGIVDSAEPLHRTIQYTVTSTGVLAEGTEDDNGGSEAWRMSDIDPQIAEFARRPEVCGVDAAGRPLSVHPLAGDHSYDGQIAVNIQEYLRNNYKYTLDLTDVGSLGDRDPIAAFLTDFKKGHCEYFAGAMTLMCQSLTIPSRLVVGFRCDPDEFNTLGNYFPVKQSDAHAWVEVFTGSRWEQFDPTSSSIASSLRQSSALATLGRFYDYLEFKWAGSVVAYDRDQRDNLMQSLNWNISRVAVAGGQNVSAWPKKLDLWWEQIRVSLLDATIALTLACGVASVVGYLLERRKMQRRAKRIGLDALPPGQRAKLVRQLAFYDELIRVLNRHDLDRPENLTPLEFCRSLNFLPNVIYDDIYRLTQVFYRVRYGGADLNSHRQEHLAAAVSRIESAMSATPRRRAAT
jgi:transglutaminase-like putative cysteine protease